MPHEKPQIAVTIKFRGVTIEGMTVQELRDLRDLLNELVDDEKEYIPYPQPYPVYPATPWWSGTWTIITSDSRTVSGHDFTADDGSLSGGVPRAVGGINYTLTCHN